jgi:phospholipid transport system substrate-binding protein
VDLVTSLVRDTSEQMLAVLKSRRADLDREPRLIYQLVHEKLVPKFDFERITQSAMGVHWRKATPEQRQQLIGEFRQLLVRTYAKALLNYSGQQIRYLPLSPGRTPDDVTVQTQVAEGGGPVIPIDYRLYLQGGTWKVYDLVIDGVSLVANYRTSFAAEVGRGGVEGLIRTLQSRNADDRQ